MNSFCTNLDGGFVCSCPAGYTGNPYTVCYPDIMRCSKNNECPGNILCIDDAHHGKHCGCESPYIREGDYCIMMSRNCSSSVFCPENQECVSTGSGTGFCICPKGFTLDAAGQCRDINECSEMGSDFDLCGINSECINTPGSYQCICSDGFTGNGKEACSRIRESFASFFAQDRRASLFMSPVATHMNHGTLCHDSVAIPIDWSNDWLYVSAIPYQSKLHHDRTEEWQKQEKLWRMQHASVGVKSVQ